MPTNPVLMFNTTLSPCHRPKKTCGVGGHPTRSGVNNLQQVGNKLFGGGSTSALQTVPLPQNISSIYFQVEEDCDG